MKVFHCSVSEQGSWGYYKNIECIVVANNQTEALGLALQEYPDTHANDWTTINEIDTNKIGVTPILYATS